MINTQFKSLILGATIVSILSGCATSRSVTHIQKNTLQAVNERADAGREVTQQSSSFVVNKGSFYAAFSPLTKKNMRTLPDSFDKDANFIRSSSISLNELSTHITKTTGLKVFISPDILNEKDGKITLSDISYTGNLSGLLDTALGELNLSWRWNPEYSRIEVYRYETKIFRIKGLAGTTDVNTSLDTTSSSTVSTGGSSSGSGKNGNSGTSGQQTKITSNFDIWTDISNVIKGILSSNGTMSIASSAGMVTVRDTPIVLSQVEEQINEFNKIYSRQVKLNVEVYAVENSASDNYGADFSVAWAQAANKYGLNFNNNGTGNTGSGPGLSGVVNTGPFSGSSLILQALSSIGNTSLLTSGSISSLNGQSVPMNVSTEQAYLESYSTNTTGSSTSTSTTTLTPGVVNGGFSMNFTPQVMDDNDILLRYSIDLSSIDQIVTFNAPDGNSAIQLPTRSVRNFMQNVSVSSGQTLVLTGFQQTSAATKNSGPFSSNAWFLGGQKNAEKKVKTIVIVVTPYILEK